ncbi:unnamed protein product [Acanthocheilonema viteae]|uniref:Uncharacterized protein n=1 Tax=Acanthocheilonema viteae TaxID=6277 RepID=A0A498SKY5_ACAVI|nr:unnamed protein product [Acanthocheilonema viteae]
MESRIPAWILDKVYQQKEQEQPWTVKKLGDFLGKLAEKNEELMRSLSISAKREQTPNTRSHNAALCYNKYDNGAQLNKPVKEKITLTKQINPIRKQGINQNKEVLFPCKEVEILHWDASQFSEKAVASETESQIVVQFDICFFPWPSDLISSISFGNSVVEFLKSKEITRICEATVYVRCNSYSSEDNGTIYTASECSDCDQNEDKLELTPMKKESLDIDRFWKLELIGIQEHSLLHDQDQVLKKFKDTITKANGRYQVAWPWNETNIKLNNNLGLCFGRLKSLIDKLQSNETLLLKYDEIICDQWQFNVIEKLSPEIDQIGVIHYLPHHEIITPTKTTTKLIVYDASAHSNGMKSLNDILHRGPLTLPNLDASMNIREFLSNDQESNAKIPKEDQAEKTQLKNILGINWSPRHNIIRVSPKPWDENLIPTKRTILEFMASQYDPLEFLTQCLVPIKLFLQNLWKKHVH